MVRFLENANCKAFGPLTGCEPNVDQQERPLIFFVMVPWLLQQEDLFCLSHCETRWIMTVDNVGIKNKPFGDLKLYGQSYIFFSLM